MRSDALPDDAGGEGPETGTPKGADLVRLGEGEIAAVAALMAGAFMEDPVAKYLVPGRRARGTVLPELYALSLRLALRCGEVVVPRGALSAVGAWLLPGGAVFDQDVDAIGGTRAYALLGAAGAARLTEVASAFAEARERLAPEPHWYLSLLAVDPMAQRRGLGAAILGHLGWLATRRGERIYLETTNPANLTYYEREGFVSGGREETPGGLVFWPLVRPGRTGS